VRGPFRLPICHYSSFKSSDNSRLSRGQAESDTTPPNYVNFIYREGGQWMSYVLDPLLSRIGVTAASPLPESSGDVLATRGCRPYYVTHTKKHPATLPPVAWKPSYRAREGNGNKCPCDSNWIRIWTAHMQSHSGVEPLSRGGNLQPTSAQGLQES
jgi:hypothetical protein